MAEVAGNSHPRVIDTIKHAIDLDANGQTALAAQVLMNLVLEFHRASAVHGYLAWYLSQIGQQDEALEHSRQAAALSPRSYTASLIHFHVLWAAGRRIDALDEMKRFVAIRPSATEYRALLDGWRDEEDQDDGKIIDDVRRCLTNGGSAE